MQNLWFQVHNICTYAIYQCLAYWNCFNRSRKKVSLFRNKKLHYTLLSWFFDKVGKFASRKFKKGSNFPNHDVNSNPDIIGSLLKHRKLFYSIKLQHSLDIFFVCKIFSFFYLKGTSEFKSSKILVWKFVTFGILIFTDIK